MEPNIVSNPAVIEHSEYYGFLANLAGCYEILGYVFSQGALRAEIVFRL